MADALAKFDEGIWGVDGFAKLAPGVRFPARATVVKLKSGGLLVHSPIDFTDDQAAAIGRLGEVELLMAPNLFHHLFLQRAQSCFPDAAIIGVEGIEKKAKKVAFDAVFSTELPKTLVDDFDYVRIEGAPAFEEAILLHRATRTLVVADYFFNIQESKGWLAPWVLRMTGTYKKPAQSKLWNKMTKDREAMCESARRVLALDFDRIVMCHGAPISEGRGFAEEALRDWQPHAK